MELSRKYMAVNPSTTLAIDSKFKEMKNQGMDVVGFGAGEPDFDTPQYIKDAAIKAINDGLTKYTPAAGTIELKKAIVRKLERENGLSYDISNIVVSNGAKHSLMNALGAILNEGDEVILPAPYWVSYKEMITLSGGVPVIINAKPENGLKFTVDELKGAITDKTKALIFNSPSNPTGAVYDNDEIKAIAEVILANDMFVISDEIYEHLIYDIERPMSIANVSDEMKERTIIVNGVSKSYSMTGWRIGYTAANKEVTKIMSNVQSHYTSNPNSIAQAATIAALDGGLSFVNEMKVEFKARRDYMVDAINEIEGISCQKPGGAFYVMMDISKIKGKSYNGKVIETSDDFAEIFLSSKLVALVPCSGFGNDDFLRWSYATSLSNIKEGIKRLKEFINELN